MSEFDFLWVRKMFIMLVQLVILSSYSSLIWFCEAHGPLHGIYYGHHRFNPSSSSSSIPSSSLASSLTSSSPSSPTIDLSLFANHFIDPTSSSSSSEPNHDRSENDIIYSHFANSVNSIPSCNQLKYLWKEANRLAINLYGSDFAFSHPKLHANPFYLTNLLLRKYHHTHSYGGGGGGGGTGSDKAIFIGSEPVLSRFQPHLVSPTFGILENSNNNEGHPGVPDKGSADLYSEMGEFGSIQDRLTPTSSLGQSPVPGQFSDYSIPKNDLGAIYGNIVMSPDQLSTHSTSSSTSTKPLATSSLQSPSSSSSSSSSSTSSPLSSSTSRKDAKHKQKMGFGDVITNSKETYDSNLDEASHRSSESSKKVDNLFNLGFWHDTPIDLS